MIKKYSYLILIFILIAGFFYKKIALLALLCMILPIITSFFKGRYYCKHICPRGSLYDNKFSNLSKNKNIPKILKSKSFRIIVLIIIFLMFGINLKNSIGNIDSIALIFYKMVLITTLIGVALTFFFNHRTWCAFCPMGTISDFVDFTKRKSRI